MFSADHRPFVAKDSEPYSQFWLSERERVLHGLFGHPNGATVEQAIQRYCALTEAARGPRLEAALRREIAAMAQAGVLMDETADTSRYDAEIVDAYLTHRPFPTGVAAAIVDGAPLGPAKRVLDLAGGPGDLALQLARSGAQVTLMELSRGFTTSAATRARALGLSLTILRESCNRLASDDGEYDLVTVAQALHWLDDVQVCRGVCRVLADGGRFVVVHSAIDLPDDHPLADLFGARSILGHRAPGTFEEQALAIADRLGLLFRALDRPDVHRIDVTQRWTGRARAPLGARPPWFWRQVRPIDAGFARAFLTPAHLAATGRPADAVWADIERRCADAGPSGLMGAIDWAVLTFERLPT